MKGNRRGFLSLVLIVVSTGTLLCIARDARATQKGNGAKGDSCDIEMPGGTKKPGKDDGKGHCCSVWDDKDCVDLPKPNPSPKGAIVAGAMKGGTAVLQVAPTPTPVRPRAAAGKAKGAEPTPSPTPK